MNKMKKSLRHSFLAGALALLVFSSCTINKPQEQTRKITVNGSGIVLADQSILTFEIRNRDFERDKATSAVSESSSKIMNTISMMNIDLNDVNQSGNQLTTEKGPQQWVKNAEGTWEPKDDYTICTNQIKITLKDISKTKDVGEAVLKAGGANTTLSSITYKPAESGTELRQARSLAIQNAQDTANFLAGASGCKVDKVLEIKENETVYKTTDVKSIMPANRNDLTGIVTTANVSVTANVTVTYSLMD